MAVFYIKNGHVAINDQVVTNPAHRITKDDVVRCDGVKIQQEHRRCYIVLNKPRDYITSVRDERGRKTVMDLLKDKGLPRIFPVGRLDRATTGLLLLTNDGDLAYKLSHPRFVVSKKYAVTLDKPLIHEDAQKLRTGIILDDEYVRVDSLKYLDDLRIHIVLHGGKYRVIRRMFEQLGYEVEKLDRVSYAGLSKEGLKRGEWRYLTDEEIAHLHQQVAHSEA